MSKLDTTIYVINDNGQIEETTIRAYEKIFVETTTSPHGVEPKYHLRGTEVWTWGVNGNFPKLISKHETESEAEAALDEIRLIEFYECQNLPFWLMSREQAEKFLAENAE